jgi:hypothetical protein
MSYWEHLRGLLAYLAPEPSLVSPRKHVSIVAALLAVAAIAGAVVLKPSYRTLSLPQTPDVWQNLHQRFEKRAQVDLFDDFGQGLDAWQAAGGGTSNWSYDRNGFVSLGALALYEPTLGLANYDVDALVQIESKGLGFVFRAQSARNYQAAQLKLEGSGPMRALAVETYSVTEGTASKPKVVRYPKQFQSDTLYRVHLEVRGDSFAIYLQGELIDYWSDARLAAGGVGLFCSPGERSRVAWIRVSHNADSVGRMCAVLASMFKL